MSYPTMNIPGKEESIAFFSKIGQLLTRSVSDRGQVTWTLCSDSDPVGTAYGSLLELWGNWLPWAINWLEEDRRYEAIVSTYTCSTPEKRTVLSDALASYTFPDEIPPILARYAERNPLDIDSLPADWLHMLALSYSARNGLASGILRAQAFLRNPGSNMSE
jgi:hypothetical protein